MSEPKVVSFLKLQEDPQRAPAPGPEKRSSITGLDFQRLFPTPVSRVEQDPGPSPSSPLLGGLEIGFLLGQRKPKEHVDTSSKDPPQTERHPGQQQIRAAQAALVEAVRDQDDFKVQEVLQLVGPTVLERKDGDGNTVLHLAAATQASETSTSILSYLQHCKADLEARNVLGETPLILAVRGALDGEVENGWLGAVSCLLEGRADPNAADELNEETPLMEAACYGSQEMCRLLDFRADATMKTSGGGTAIDFASSEGHDQLVKLLQREAASAGRGAAQFSQSSTSRPAPFATAVGFNTWSGGLAERWSQAPKAPSQDFDSKKPEKKKESSSQSNDFRPGLIFGPEGPCFSTNSHFMADGGYGGRSGQERRFPFAERSGLPKTSKTSNQDQHFRTLGLSPGACAEEVRAAYRKLAIRYHPDKNHGNETEAADKFRQVRHAYEQIAGASFR